MKRILHSHWVSFVPLALYWVYLKWTDDLYRGATWDPAHCRYRHDLVPSWMGCLTSLWLPFFVVAIVLFVVHGFLLRKRGWAPCVVKLLLIPPFWLFCALTVFHTE
jgi:hypothetical protein